MTKFNNHIVLCFNSAWIMQASVLITSILHFNDEDFTFHIIGNDLSDSNIQTIQKYAKSCPVIYHSLAKYDTSKLVIRPGDRISLDTYSRFFIPELLDKDIKKCLYLDSDIICTGKIKNLFDTDLTNYALGMVYDVNYSDIRNFNRLEYDKKYGYFNAGVGLFNLDYWRKKQLTTKLFDFVKDYPERCWCHDQDAINYICHSKILALPVSYNIQKHFWWIFYWKNQKNYTKNIPAWDFIAKDKFAEIEEGCKKPVLVHFTCSQKPWLLDTFVPFTKVWRYFLSKTEFKIGLQVKIRIKIILKKILRKPFDDKYPEESYKVEEKILSTILQSEKRGN